MDDITFWAGFFPTEPFSKDKKNTKAPNIALAKLSPDVFFYLKQVFEIGVRYLIFFKIFYNY